MWLRVCRWLGPTAWRPRWRSGEGERGIISVMSVKFDDDGTFTGEEVERRAEPRGSVSGLLATLPDGRQVDVLEISSKGVFAAVSQPELFLLGDVIDITVAFGDDAFGGRVEVIRKEIHPRRGVAMRIIHISPAAEETLKSILERV
jgi:hypothetical protein